MQSIPPVSRKSHSARSLTGSRELMVALALIAAAAWLYLFYLHAAMPPMTMAQMAAPNLQPWSWADLLMTFIMWAVMMAAMMLPSALPTILLFAKTNQSQGRPLHSGLFTCGYLALWAAFSVVATLLQWLLHSYGFLSAMDATYSPLLGGGVLMVAGMYQWSPLKRVCLRHCRSPLAFLLTHWREGPKGAWHMGVHHGAYCVGCCWALMLVLFVVGVMNVMWVMIIALYVLLEKLFFKSQRSEKLSGLLIILWGVWLAAH
jgi:predicted metal-binding membrane protein